MKIFTTLGFVATVLVFAGPVVSQPAKAYVGAKLFDVAFNSYISLKGKGSGGLKAKGHSPSHHRKKR